MLSGKNKKKFAPPTPFFYKSCQKSGPFECKSLVFFLIFVNAFDEKKDPYHFRNRRLSQCVLFFFLVYIRKILWYELKNDPGPNDHYAIRNFIGFLS